MNMMGQDHFDTYKSKNDHQAVADIFEFAHPPRHQKIHRSQSHDCQYIGAKNNKRIGCDGEDRRNTVHCKKDVSKLDDDQGYKKGTSIFYTFFFDEKFARFYFICYRIKSIDPFEYFRRSRIKFLIITEKHPDGGD